MSPSIRTTRGVAVVLLSSVFACSAPEPEPASPSQTDPDRLSLEADQVQTLQLGWRTVQLDTLRPVRDVPAVVAPPDTATAAVGSIVEGRVARVRVIAGDAVRAGDPLVEIHTHELTDARGSLARAGADLDYASAALDRARELHAAGAISLEELQRRERDRAGAESDVTRWSEMVEHLHPVSYDLAAAIAPFDGVVHTVSTRAGEAVLPGTPLVLIGSSESLWATARVPEQMALDLPEGTDVDVVTGDGVTLAGRVVRIGVRVDPETRAVELRVALTGVPTGLRSGSWVTVQVPTGVATEAVLLPEDAVVRSPNSDVVWVRDTDGSFERLDVEATPYGPDHLRVTGIGVGTEVVTEGAYRLEAARATSLGGGGEG